MSKPAEVRFYLDADILGLGKVLAGLRSDVTYPGDPGAVVRKRLRPPCPLASTDLKDTEWIPFVAAAGWLVITRDSNIQRHRREVGAVHEYSCKMVSLAGSGAKRTWDQLEVVMCQWRGIESLWKEPGPIIYAATRTTLRRIVPEKHQ